MSATKRPAWRPPQPYEREQLEPDEIERREVLEVDRRGGWVRVEDFETICTEARAEVSKLTLDDLVYRELRNLLASVIDRRNRYDDDALRSKPRRYRFSPAERADALAQGEGIWGPSPYGPGMVRTSTICYRDEWAILSMRGERQPRLDEVVRSLRLVTMPAGEYELVLMSVPYYSPQAGSSQIPTVQQMFIEQAMMHATARQIGRVLSNGHDDPPARHRGEVEIDRAIDRMLARGAEPPTDAKYVRLYPQRELTVDEKAAIKEQVDQDLAASPELPHTV